MKTEKFNFQWFEKEDRRKPLRATLGRDGKLRLGEELRRKLPEAIFLGFDVKKRTLAIADGHGAGIALPKSGSLNARALCTQVRSTGLKLPTIFEFEKDAESGFFLGRILPNLKPEDADMEQLLALYQPIVDAVVYQGNRSTPAEERRAYAVEEFFQAVKEYEPGCGEFADFAERQMRDRLAMENKKYTASFRNRSMDTDQSAGDAYVSLHKQITDNTSGGIYQAEARIMHKQFLDTLSDTERKLYKLMQEGCYVAQIAMELSMDEEAVILLGRQIGQKRKEFYAVT